MGYVKKRDSTAGKVIASNFNEVKQQFLLDIKVVVEIEKICLELIINLEQTSSYQLCAIGFIHHGKGKS